MWRRALAVAVLALAVVGGPRPAAAAELGPRYEHKETRDLVALVTEAADLVQTQGEAAFSDFRATGSRWRQEATYIFVLDLQGNMLVHLDPAMEGRNQLDLKDINGKPIILGLLQAATAVPEKQEGWFHYQWPIPGGILPRWKSSYVRLAIAPSGKRYVVGSGVYNDRMERMFVVDEVNDAVNLIERHGDQAFARFHDPTGPFLVKDSYIFVIDPSGIERVNPAFPNLEGRDLLDLKDAQGKPVIRSMFKAVESADAGWVDYMWPKPGESVSTLKSAYVRKAKWGDKWFLVGCGVYLADAPKAQRPAGEMTAPKLATLVREGAAVFERKGEKAYPEFRKKGAKWFHGDTYFFVWAMDGSREFHAADATLEGRNGRTVKDALGRPYGQMFLEIAASPAGEGWIHYMYPEPGGIFPIWKSVFLKRVTFPSGKQHLIGCGVYNLQIDQAIIKDVVDRAAALVAERGKGAFGALRDKTGPFLFMDTYVFVDSPDGIELVNAAQPSLEGKNVSDLRDLSGKAVAREYLALALRDGEGWVEYHWYKPGQNTPSLKRTYVRKVQAGGETYIVGAGICAD